MATATALALVESELQVMSFPEERVGAMYTSSDGVSTGAGGNKLLYSKGASYSLTPVLRDWLSRQTHCLLLLYSGTLLHSMARRNRLPSYYSRLVCSVRAMFPRVPLHRTAWYPCIA